MKLRFRCPDCNQDCFFSAPSISIALNKDINQHFIYKASCNNGHTNSYVIQDPAYEILLIQAFHFLDIKEWNASVVFFRIAHENFLKHTNFILFHYNYILENEPFDRPENLNIKDSIQYNINDYTKLLTSFKKDKIPDTGEKKAIYLDRMIPKRMKDVEYFNYIFKKSFKRNAPVVENKTRNNIIHEGYFYSEIEALDYCENLYNYMREILICLEHFPKTLDKEIPVEIQYSLLCATYCFGKIYSQQEDLDDFITQRFISQEITGINSNHSISRNNFLDFWGFLKEFSFSNFIFQDN